MATEREEEAQDTYLSDLLRLRLPLCAVLVVLDRPKLAEQQKDLGDDNAREVLVMRRRAARVGRRAGRAYGARRGQ